MANVCLILEGTYPFVAGGVSGCVHQLVSMLPNTSFTLVYIGARSTDLLTPKYKLPPNVVGVQELFLFDDLDEHARRDYNLSQSEMEALVLIHRNLHVRRKGKPVGPIPSEEARKLGQAIETLFPADRTDDRIFRSLASRKLWELLLEEYGDIGSQMPFMDFFYTWRSCHLPIYRMMSGRFPKAQVYHSLCTGYAGIAGMVAAIQNQAPFFITEHGIYAHERAIELAEADWLYRQKEISLTSTDPARELKLWWIDLFKNMSRIAYSFASEIITLYDGNRQREIQDGAPSERIRIIPNGINRRFQGLRKQTPPWPGAESGQTFTMGFIGRVVSIKDVKTLIKACKTIVSSYENVKCKIIGPTDEEPEYYKQCQDMVELLGLKGVVEFMGKQDVTKMLPSIDCLMLTSISEAQPLTILEANVAGVPVVSTRVGSCKDLLEGVDGADRRLGPSGLLADIGDSEAIAKQTLKIIYDKDLWIQMSEAGMKRVDKYYDERDLTSRYGVLYREHGGGSASVPGLPAGVLPWQALGSD